MLAFAVCVAVVANVAAGGRPASASTSSSPQAIGLQPGDVPGFAPIDPGVESFRDPNDQGTDQAFIQCATQTPLLSQFDSGPDATVSQVYGQGTDAFGTPTLAVGTAVFTDGSAADAFTAYSALARTSFQNCWASTMDSLNTQQGIATPIVPTTVAPLATPQLGAGSTGFVMNLDYSALGTPVTGQFGFTVIDSGSVVTMLITTAYGTTFPAALRGSIIDAIAHRMGAMPRNATPAEPTSGTGACDLIASAASNVLLTDSQVDAALGRTVRYKGWTDSPASATGNVDTRACTWQAPVGRSTVVVSLSMSAPYPVGGARTQYTSNLSGWQPTTTVSGLGDAAFWVPYQDVGQALEVLSGNRVFIVGIEAPASQVPEHQAAERALAQIVLDRIGASIPSTGPSSTPSGPQNPDSEPSCGPSVSVSAEPTWLGDLNTKMQKFAKHKLPVSVATVKLPGGLFMNLAPSLEPGDFSFCSAGIANAVLPYTPWSTADSSLDVSVTGEGEDHLGPFTYSSELATWTNVDKNVTPPDQKFTTDFNVSPKLTSDLGISLSHEGLQTDLTVAEVVLASDRLTLKLVVNKGEAFSVELGPELALDLQISKKNLVDELGKDLAEGESEDTAANDLSKQIADDASAATEVEGEGFYGLTPTEIGAKLEPGIDKQMLSAFKSWLAELQPGSADAQELANEDVTAADVTADDLPANVATALEGEAVGGADIGYTITCEMLFGGPEDLVGDLVCFK